VLPPVASLPAETVTRRLALIEEMSKFFDDTPAEAELGTIVWDSSTDVGTWKHFEWRAPVTENPTTGATEIWQLFNVTADAHPMHIHEVVFEVVNRQNIAVFEDLKQVQIDPASPPTPPEPGETGFKDTVIAYPGQVTRVRAQFRAPGQFVWHCHIVEHEDNDMMRPYRIGPLQPGQPL
jgi:FtsP/CotA-like multicopper oxidase with cupredoxin domain